MMIEKLKELVKNFEDIDVLITMGIASRYQIENEMPKIQKEINKIIKKL